jgi:hypothetical protein
MIRRQRASSAGLLLLVLALASITVVVQGDKGLFTQLKDAVSSNSDDDIFTKICPAPFDLSDNPYTVLGVSRKAKDSTVTKKYRALAKIWHPDKQRHRDSCDSGRNTAAGVDTEATAAEAFAAIGHAYGILSDATKRDVYDRLGTAGLRRLQDGDPRVKKGYLPPDEVLRRHARQNDPPLGMVDWVITSVFAWLEGKPQYD